MIDKDGHISKYQRRSIAAKMAKVIERFVMDESLDNITVRVDILDVKIAMEDLLKEYDAYDPIFGDDKECKCGHPYYRHFDTYDKMAPIGCKYCECREFR
jgi:hypothetical protein